MKESTKRKQLERRGWSEARIHQYLKDWKFCIPWNTNPKSVGQHRGR